ncbi:MAG: GNAT family N-acetyltransferase [Lachnospiraceae bacterium]|nr:GNAT family N-acetyltransferase [Lachnospiraceae bacterium]
MAELYKKAFGTEPWNDDWSDINQLKEYIKEISSGHHPLNYGLLREGKLCAVSIGQVKHWWQGTECYLDELFVDPNEQGQGIGSRFLQMIEEDVKKRGLSGIFLQTDNDKPAYGFYQRRSFKELTEHVSFFKEIQ